MHCNAPSRVLLHIATYQCAASAFATAILTGALGSAYTAFSNGNAVRFPITISASTQGPPISQSSTSRHLSEPWHGSSHHSAQDALAGLRRHTAAETTAAKTSGPSNLLRDGGAKSTDHFRVTKVLATSALSFAAIGLGLLRKRKTQNAAMYSTTGTLAGGYAASTLSHRFTVFCIPMFDDNYGWLITDLQTKECAAVDPGEAEPIIKAVESMGLQMTHILITHKHGDHTGGNLTLKRRYPGLQIIGTGYEPIPGIDVAVKEGMQFDLFGDTEATLQVSVIATPCHTKGHVVFYVQPKDGDSTPALFSGDTLFVGGCGRFFEGDARQMHTALVDKIGNLPPETMIFCAHEYTESNLKFALQVEPQNTVLQAKVRWVEEQRKHGRPTVPSSLGEERAYNPFVRCGEADIMQRVGAVDAIESMRLLREGKNRGDI